MEHLMYLIKGYSLPMILMSVICIFVVGCFKALPFVKKLSKQWKTVLLFALDIIFAFSAIPIYFCITKIEITVANVFTTAPILVACILSVYSLYENIGIKKLIASILTIIATTSKRIADNKADAKEKAKYESCAEIASIVAKMLNSGFSTESNVSHPVEEKTREINKF